MSMESPDQQWLQAFLADDCVIVAQLLADHPQLRARLNDGLLKMNMPPLAAAKSREMVDLLIGQGARVEVVGDWWAPGFGAEQVERATARYLVEKGAKLTIHAATGIGLMDVVEQMLDRDPTLVTARGGDGCHPLHFCSDLEIARLLIDRGAEVDARDDDHDSTPAQWRIGDAAEITKWLINHGATPDIFMAAGLGDIALAKRLVSDDPKCTAYRIGNNKGKFPGIGFQDRGGTIYQWSLGFNLSPHEVALKFGHKDVYDYLIERSAAKELFLVACTSADRPLAESIAMTDPEIVSTLDEEDQSLLAKFCWETNKNIEAVRLMLDVGFPVDASETNHGFTALHNAAWCGDPELVRLLISRGHPTNIVDPKYDATAIGYAVHSCVEAKRHPEGKFPEVVELLLEAGVPFDTKHYPVGHAGIDAVIKAHLGIEP